MVYTPFYKKTNLFLSILESKKSIELLCPTRWTVRGSACNAIISNYDTLCELWSWVESEYKDSDTIARVRGVSAQMLGFEFYFSLKLNQLLFSHTDNLSKALQKKTLTSSQGKDLMSKVVQVLEDMRNDSSYDTFWGQVTKEARGSYI